MSSGDIATTIGGLTAFFGAMYATWRSARSDKMKSSSDNAAILLGGWEKFHNTTLAEVDRVRKSCQEEIAALKAEHEQDRVEWAKEKKLMQEAQQEREMAMQKEIDTLKTQVLILIEKNTRGES